MHFVLETEPMLQMGSNLAKLNVYLLTAYKKNNWQPPSKNPSIQFKKYPQESTLILEH